MEKSVRINDIIFDMSANEIHIKGDVIRLAPRLSNILQLFVENPGKPLTRQEIIDTVWQKKIVNDDALSRCIAELRSSLNDDPQTPTVIETLPKIGYRFIAQLENVTKQKSVRVQPLMFFPPLLVLFLSLVGTYIWYDTSIKEPDWLMRINHAKRITSTAQIEAQAQLSPSGDLLAYSSFKNPYFGVDIMNANGEILTTIVDNNAHVFSPTFSPDEKSLFVAKINGQRCEIYEVSLGEKQQTKWLSCAVPPYRSGLMEWSSNNRYLAYVDNNANANNTAIWIYDAYLDQKQQISFPTSSQHDTRPRFSPDNQWLTYQRYSGDAPDIVRVALNQSHNIEILLSEPFEVVSHDWLSADSLLFDSERNGERHLWRYIISEKKLTNIGGKNGLFASTDAQNTRILFQEVEHQSQIFLVDRLTNIEEAVTNSPGLNSEPAFSPNEKGFLYTAQTNGYESIWYHDRTTKNNTQLLSISNTNISNADWSEDGLSFIAKSDDMTTNACVVYSITEKSLEYFPFEDEETAFCRLGNKDQIFRLTVSPKRKLLSLEPDGNWYEIASDVFHFSTMNDGKVVYNLVGQEGLFVWEPKTKTVTKTLDDIDFSMSLIWTTKNQHIYVTQSADKKGTWRVNIETSEWEKISEYESYYINSGAISVAADESKILLVKITRKEGDLYLTSRE